MSVAILADDTQKHKPDPEPLLICLERLGCQPEDTIYIGDAASDYLAAQNAHVAFGYAKWEVCPARASMRPIGSLKKPLDLLKLMQK